MSNLNLPKMSFDNLNRLLGNRTAKTLAYATTAERDGDRTIIVRHHGNAIATISDDVVTLSTAGWHSRTTANRLNAILAALELPGRYGIGITQGQMVLREFHGKKPIETPFNRIEIENHEIVEVSE